MNELSEFCDARGLTIAAHYIGTQRWNEDTRPTNKYRVTLKYQGRRLTTEFYTGVGWKQDPTAADVLACLILDARSAESATFEEFCAYLDYSNDSRKAERIYRKCKSLGPRIRRLLGADFDAFASKEH